MAPRRTTKGQSRQKQAPAAEHAPVAFSPNGESMATVAAAIKTSNGRSPSFDQIQRRAYELFEARGRSHGWDLADWFTAEEELTAGSLAAQ